MGALWERVKSLLGQAAAAGFSVRRSKLRMNDVHAGSERNLRHGQWVNDRTDGKQFEARFLRTPTPTSVLKRSALW